MRNPRSGRAKHLYAVAVVGLAVVCGVALISLPGGRPPGPQQARPLSSAEAVQAEPSTATPVAGQVTASQPLPSASGAAAPTAGGRPLSNKPSPVIKADRDRNKIFDDLEMRLGSMAPSESLGVIVTLPSPASPSSIDGLKAAVGDFAVGHRFSIVNGFSATVTAAQVPALARLANVGHVEEDSVVRATNESAQKSFGVTDARVQAPGLDGGDGNSVYSKDDLVAAVIDTGIDASHPELDQNKVIDFEDFVNGTEVAYDDEGHGTHVAATVAGDGLHYGVAPGAALVGVKVLDSNGSGTMADVTAAIEWVVQNPLGIDVINLSLGASGCSDGNDATSVAVNNAHAAGLVVAVAAGNDGAGTCTIGSPGAAANALTVGAMADLEQGGFKQADFSSRGRTADNRNKPDVSAPGVAITSAEAGTDDYVAFSGTSMATPFTAGVALLMKEAGPGLDAQAIKDRIMTNAVDWGRGGDNKSAGSRGVDIDYGAGRLDAHAAIKAAGAELGAAPAVPMHRVEEGTLPGSRSVADFKVNVTDTRFPIAATLIHPSITGASASKPDFDLRLYNPSGSQVAYAGSSNRQEDVTYKPPVTGTGTYTLRVESYSGSGAYFVDMSYGDTPDTTAPTVGPVSPAGGVKEVALNTKVSVPFSEPMNQTTAESAFSLVSLATDSDGKALLGTYSWSGNTMTFTPAALAKNTSYRATVTTAAKDSAGNALAAEHSWTFTTTSQVTITNVTAYPASTTVEQPGGGKVRSGDFRRLVSDNNSYYMVNSTTSGTRTASWYGRFTKVPRSLASLSVTYRGKHSRTAAQTVEIYNWATPGWVVLNAQNVGTTEIEISAQLGGTLANYVSGTAADGDLLIRVRATNSSGSFYSSGDLMRIIYGRPS